MAHSHPDPDAFHAMQEHLMAIRLLIQLVALELPEVQAASSQAALLTLAEQLNAPIATLQRWKRRPPRP